MAVPILKEPPISMRDAVIPYFMAGINMLAPTLAAYSALSPRILMASVAMIIVGIPFSIYFRQRQYNRIKMNLLILFPLLIFTWMMMRSQFGAVVNWDSLWESVLVANFGGEQINWILQVFTLLAAGRAFLLVTPMDLLQTPGPGICIFLLSIETALNTDIERRPFTLFCLLLLFISSLYLFGHQQNQQWFTVQPPYRLQNRLLKWVVLFTLLFFPLIGFLGWRMHTFNMWALANRQSQHPFRFFRTPFSLTNSVGISLNRDIAITGIDWPRGNQKIMTVEVKGDIDQELLWRAATYARYENQRWTLDFLEYANGLSIRQDGPVLRLSIDPTSDSSDPGIKYAMKVARSKGNNIPANLRCKTIEQTFTMEAPLLEPPIPVYGAFQIQEISTNLKNGIFKQAFLTRDGSLVLKTRDADHITQPYTVISITKPLPGLFALPDLKKLPPKELKQYQLSQKDREKYLQMPGGNSMIPGQRDSENTKTIRRLALKILEDTHTSSADPNTFRIAKQLDLYLKKYYYYTLKPAPPKKDMDPIVDFLKYQKKGYCNYFSGAMVMLCRSIGIPARFVVGFATGETLDQANENGSTVKYQVTAKDAHSWVEIFLPNYGWFTIDPTAGSQEWPTLWGKVSSVSSIVFSTIKNALGYWIEAIRSDRRVRAVFFLLLAAISVTLAGIIYWRRERPPAYPKRALNHDESVKTIVSAYRRMHRWLDMWGVSKPPSYTASEFAETFRGINPPMGVVTDELTDLYRRAYYGANKIADPDARRAIELLYQLWELAPTERKHFHAVNYES